jgi:two-component sensor histidine kinase
MVEWGVQRWRSLWRVGLRPGSPASLLFALACVVVATGLRMLLGLLSADSTVFAPYYSATLVAVLVGGMGAGFLAAGLGGIAAYWLFALPEWRVTAETAQQLTSLIIYGISSAVIIAATESHRRLLQQLRSEESMRQLLNFELAHRIRNILANVQAILRQSLGGHKDVLEIVNARIAALGATHDLLVRSKSRATSLRDILTCEFAPYGLWRFELKGEPIDCPAAVVVALGLIFHELTTNAVKYGALSRPEGGVSIIWRREGRRLHLEWVERGGPRPAEPARSGFGTRLLHSGLKRFDGVAQLRFEPTGLKCSLSLCLRESPELETVDDARATLPARTGVSIPP